VAVVATWTVPSALAFTVFRAPVKEDLKVGVTDDFALAIAVVEPSARTKAMESEWGFNESPIVDAVSRE
jgi:hypothetical protein